MGDVPAPPGHLTQLLQRWQAGDAGSLLQRVTGSLEVRAGQTQTVVEGRSIMTAKNASIVTEEAMTINGEEIHLG